MLLACGGDSSVPADAKVNDTLLMRDEIGLQEKMMRSSQVLDNKIAELSISKYVAYADRFPMDSMSADYLFKAAEISTGIRRYEQSVELYRRIDKNYPAYPLAQESLYLQGYVLDNFLDKDGEARMVYEKVIEKYPSSPYAVNARDAIANLGKSDEELIREFKKKNKEIN